MTPDPEALAVAHLMSDQGCPEQFVQHCLLVRLKGLRKQLTTPFQRESYTQPSRQWEFHRAEKMKSLFKAMARPLT